MIYRTSVVIALAAVCMTATVSMAQKKADVKPESTQVAKHDAAPITKPGAAPAVKPEATPAAKPAAKPEAKGAPEAAAKPEIKIPDLPGITTPDRTPQACVNCHVNHPEMNMDFRLTAVLARWAEKTDHEIVVKAKAASPRPDKIKGKHPDVKALVKVIPTDCLMCHNSESKLAPPFNKLLHAIHIVGGKDNHFLSMANGNCTSCHKLETKTGTWTLGSGEEKE